MSCKIHEMVRGPSQTEAVAVKQVLMLLEASGKFLGLISGKNLLAPALFLQKYMAKIHNDFPTNGTHTVVCGRINRYLILAVFNSGVYKNSHGN